MGPCCGKEIGQGRSKVRVEAKEQIEIAYTESGQMVTRLSRHREPGNRSRSRRDAIVDAHVENASRSGVCNLGNMMFEEVNNVCHNCKLRGTE